MIKKLFVVTLLSLTYNVQAQQIPMYNQFHIAPCIYNPSYAGFYEGVNIVMVRNQKWGNYGEGFNANYLSTSYLLKDRHGLGINLYNDYVGITSKLKAHLLYSYKIKLGEKASLRAGAGLGVVDNRLDFSTAVVTDPTDPVLQNTGKARRTMFDLNVGLNFEVSGFRVGVSVPQVLGSKLVYGDMNGSYYTLERQYLMNTGYTWRISDTTAGGMSLRPEALVMYTPGAPFQYSAGLFFEMDKYFWIGGMYKSDYAIGINLGINLIKNLKIGLAYDYQITSIASLNTAPNAEILLRYNIPPKIQKEIDSGPVDSLMMVIENQNTQIGDLNNEVTDKQNTIKDRDETIDSLLRNWPKEQVVKVDTNSNNNERIDPNDYFIELNGSDTPNGYYVISGVFAEKSNADGRVRAIKSKFPSARVIKNKRNNLYYVMLYSSTKKDEGLAYASYKARQLPDEETWILNYQRPDNK